MNYIHQSTTLGAIQVRGNGLEVECTVTILAKPDRGPVRESTIEFLFQNRTTDHEAGVKQLIDGALAKGRSLAEAYIAARNAA